MGISRTRLFPAVIVGSGTFTPSPTPTPTPTPSLTPFAMTSTGASYAAAHQTAPSYRKQYHIDRMYRRLEASTAWTKLIGLYVMSETDQAAHKVNLRSPGTRDLIPVGAPTWTAGKGISSASVSDYYRTQTTLGDLSPTNVAAGYYVEEDVALNGNVHLGALDGSGGLTMTGSGGFSARMFAANVTTASSGGSGKFQAVGFRSASKTSATGHTTNFNGRTTGAPTTTALATAAPTLELYLLKGNGVASVTSATLSMYFIGQGLTEAEQQEIYGAVRTYQEAIATGSPLIYDPGIGPGTVTVDFAVYGTTSASIAAAVAFKRKYPSRSVAMIGGWLDRHHGGMSGSGLGRTDWGTKARAGGFPRTIINRTKVIRGNDDGTLEFSPKDFAQACREMLDPSFGGYDIPTYFTRYAPSASPLPLVVTALDGQGFTRLVSITTGDGRKINATYWHDGSYEGDLIAAVGIPCVIGRESADGPDKPSSNNPAGYIGVGPTSPAGNNFFKLTQQNVSPFVVEGDSASGLLPGIIPLPAKVVGQADDEVQSFNYRLSVGGSTARSSLFPTTPPAGYNAQRYEVLGRWMKAVADAGSTTVQWSDLQITGGVTGYPDFNHTGPLSTNLWGSGTAYTKATTAGQRLGVMTDMRNHIYGWFYWLTASGDARIPAPVVTSASVVGLSNDHYLDPANEFGERMNFPWQPYIREFRRMAACPLSPVFNYLDLRLSDGATPRSIKTVAVGAYTIDKHHAQQIADTASTPVRTWNEGRLGISGGGGTDGVVMLPYEITVPVKAMCVNISTSTAPAVTSVAWGETRMEISLMLMGQASALAAGIAQDAGGAALQDVDYPTLRAALLAEPDAVPVYLPQVE